MSTGCSTRTPNRRVPFDHLIYVIASDGDIEEGITSEASSIAGRQQLGNLIVFYDHNQISIEDDTNIALSEDIVARYEAYGWHTQNVDGGENVGGILDAIDAAKAVTDKPSFIELRASSASRPRTSRTPARSTARPWARTRSPPPRRSSASTREDFKVSDEVLAHTRETVDEGSKTRPVAGPLRRVGRRPTRRRRSCWTGCSRGSCLTAGRAPCRVGPDAKGVATRAASGRSCPQSADMLPELWGGSADLAESNNTTMKGADSFGPVAAATQEWNANPYGRTLHFGIREHAMGAILTGIAVHGPTRPYGGTFLVSPTTCVAPSGSPPS